MLESPVARRHFQVLRLLSVGLLAPLLSCLPAAHAQTVTQYQEGTQLIRGAEAPTTHGTQLFGDAVSLYTGGLEFTQTDVSLPGNNALSVSFGRRMKTGVNSAIGGHLFDWEFDIPHIRGVFSQWAGWRVMGSTEAERGRRCSYFDRELMPAQLAQGSWVEGGFPLATMSIPGQGEQELQLRSPAYGSAPVGGGPYPVVSKDGWQFSCLPTLAPGSQGSGEGFLARSPDGITYRFDRMVVRPGPSLQLSGGTTAMRVDSSALRVTGPGEVQPNVAIEDWKLLRNEVWLLPTLVTDRFGNTVRYTYSSQMPWALTAVESSDGRRLTLTYDTTTRRLSTVSDGVRTWVYRFNSTGLYEVQQPDGTAWRFSGDNLKVAPEGTGGLWTRVMQHPSGAVGTFQTTAVAHFRSFVPSSGNPMTPNVASFISMSLTRKTLSGPGVPALSWQYSYLPAVGGNLPCSGCSSTRAVQVTDARGFVTRHVFGMRWRDNEGQLLQTDEGWNGSSALRTVTYRYRAAGAGPYPAENGYSYNFGGDGVFHQKHRPQDRRGVTQQGSNFLWEATEFDLRARAARVVRSGPSGSRTELTAYHDNTSAWVLGQVASVTDVGTGLKSEQHDYHPSTASRTARYAFGFRTGRWDYHPDGTVSVAYDAAGRPTSLSNYRLGLAQTIAHPDGTLERATVNALGLVTSVTNAAGTTTSYGYDIMGRLNSVTPPGGDAVGYHPTQITFAPSPFAAYGLAAGHWLQTVTTGRRVTQRFYDALWRERLSRTWDMDRESETVRMVQTRWDADGRKSFESVPRRAVDSIDASVPGAGWAYDALGRVVRQWQDSELGVLTTTTDYLANFQKRVTSPRGHATTTAFQTFDSPSEDAITAMWAPEGVTVSIARDVFGKARSIMRAGTWAGGGVSATRSYVYDAQQRLCKTIEPETGATIQAYDAAGNVAWRASGQTLTSTAACDQGSVMAGSRISFGYDARNRLTGTSFGDGTPGIARSYTPDGLPLQVVSSSFTWTYVYNNRRLLVQEQLSGPGQQPGQGWNFSYGMDAHGSVSSLSDPSGTMSYAPNALGEPTQVSGYASAVSHHPNGAVAGYRLANGITRSVSLNARGLPLQWQDAGVVNDQYSYDANGNVTGIQDRLQGINTRSLAYDGLDRLTTASGPWGSGTFGYDALDNLRSSQVGGRTLTHAIDPATNRLVGLGGSQNVTMRYDANGNLAQRGAQGYGFDIGNRMRAALGKATYDYDGHGRRSWVVYADGSTLLNAYSGAGAAGQLRFSAHSVKGNTRYVYLGDKLIAEANSQTGTSFSHTDALGSPVARTNGSGGVIERTRYEPYGATVAGSANPSSIGFTGHVNDADTGLVYMQQRYYEPVAGRFLSVDQVTTDANDGSSFNRYVYGNNNPYKFTDPDGRHPVLWGIAAVVTRAVATVAGRVAGAARAATRNEKQQDPMQRGRESEGRVLKDMGKEKNTTAVEAEGKKSIPDFQDSKQVGEIKDTKRLTDTEQIRTQREAAKAEGKEHVVVTGNKTDVSAPVQENSTVIRRPDLGPK
ncbi:MAG: hypothetical protein IPF94_01430 [Betaproteobacteria bacterium]|nr:hypothetical protein [Betaproteobacteria bacterium]